MKKKAKLRPFLYEDEVKALFDAAKGSRYPLRDQTIILLTYNHGFRAGEVCKLVWKDIDFTRDKIIAKRQKGGVTFTHDLEPMEKSLLLQMFGEGKDIDSPIFISERGYTFSRHTIKFLVMRLQKKANLETWAHTHMLRHAKGVFLRKKKIPLDVIRDFLGHKHISSTEVYTRMADTEFTDINKGSIFC